MRSRDKAQRNCVSYAFSKHCSRGSATVNFGKRLHQESTLLRVWGSEFGIPGYRTGRFTVFAVKDDQLVHCLKNVHLNYYRKKE